MSQWNPYEETGFVSAIRAHASSVPSEAALIHGDRELTFADVERRSSAVADRLAAAGVAPGDRVGYLAKNTPSFVDLLIGSAKIGAVLVPINWRLSAGEAAFIAADSTAKLVVVEEDLAAAAELRTVVKTVALDIAEEWAGAGGRVDQSTVGENPRDVVVQMYTSGTTGLPKGAMLTHGNVRSELCAVSDAMAFDSTSVNLTVMPLFHIAGVAGLLVALWSGRPTVLLREFDPGEVLMAVERYKVTHAIFVPAVIQTLLGSPELASFDLTSMRTILYGASPISEYLLDAAMEAFGCDFVQAYGLTETTGMAVSLTREDHRASGDHPERLRSSGVPLSCMEALVAAPGGGVQPPGEIGEVWLRGDLVMAGYWNRPQDTAEAIDSDGWFRTGDLGYMDADGYLYLHDRLKDMIVSGGENVYPAEVENAIMSHPDVMDAAIIGVPDEKWGETVKAVVVRTPGAEVAEAELIEWCRRSLAGYKCPTSVDWIESLPRNPTGKILKRVLRAPYWDGKDRQIN